MSLNRDWRLIAKIINEPAALADVCDVLDHEHLRGGASLAYQAICSLSGQGLEPTGEGVLRWVEAQVKWDQRLDVAGGLEGLQTRLMACAKVTTLGGARGIAGEIRREVVQQRLSTYLYLAHNRAAGPVANLGEFINEIESTVADLRPSGEILPMNGKEAAKIIFARHEDESQRLVCPTGLPDLDVVLGGGFEEGRLYVVASRPGVGKTALALDCTRRIARKGQGVFVASLEMGPPECFARIIAGETKINSTAIAKGTTPSHQLGKLTHGMKNVIGYPIEIADAAGQTVFGISSLIRRAVRNGAKMAVVDYLGLLSPAKGQPKELWQRKGDNARHLKILAQSLKIPIVLLTQINQRVDNREDKRPRLADLYGSGEIAMHADCVVTLYRDSVYDPDIRQKITEVHVVKNRSGALGKIDVRYWPEFNRFAGLSKLEVVQ